MPTLWTIGYERLPPDALVAELEAAGVERVIDVRRVVAEQLRARAPELRIVDL